MLIVHQTGQVEVAIPVTAPMPGSDVAVQTLPGVTAGLSLVHVGGYDGLRLARDTLFNAMTARGLQAAGPLRVVYHRFGADCAGYRLDRSCLAAHPGEYVTELLVPVATVHGLRRGHGRSG
jgi:hypothetical protein